MRFTGKLTTWHDDRGFGFITPDGGGQEIFVHVSELPHARAPVIGQAYGFEVSLNPQGKKKAVGVYVHSEIPRSTPSPRRQATRSEASPGIFSFVVLSLVLAGVVFGVYRYQSARAGFAVPDAAPGADSWSAVPRDVPRPAAAPLVARPAAPSLFKCDGRTHCSQMTTCSEATYFLKNCPGTQMDGDNDGIPCEQQLCTGF